MAVWVTHHSTAVTKCRRTRGLQTVNKAISRRGDNMEGGLQELGSPGWVVVVLQLVSAFFFSATRQGKQPPREFSVRCVTAYSANVFPFMD